MPRVTAVPALVTIIFAVGLSGCVKPPPGYPVANRAVMPPGAARNAPVEAELAQAPAATVENGGAEAENMSAPQEPSVATEPATVEEIPPEAVTAPAEPHPGTATEAASADLKTPPSEASSHGAAAPGDESRPAVRPRSAHISAGGKTTASGAVGTSRGRTLARLTRRGVSRPAAKTPRKSATAEKPGPRGQTRPVASTGTTGGEPPAGSGGQERDYAWASEIRVSEERLARYSDAELEKMAREIEARRGKRFDDPKWQAYFDSKRWYYPDDKYTDAHLSRLERENIKTIERVRAQRAAQQAQEPQKERAAVKRAQPAASKRKQPAAEGERRLEPIPF